MTYALKIFEDIGFSQQISLLEEAFCYPWQEDLWIIFKKIEYGVWSILGLTIFFDLMRKTKGKSDVHRLKWLKFNQLLMIKSILSFDLRATL